MSEYDVDGDGYADPAITVEYGDTTATVVDTDGDGFADAVIYEPAEESGAGYEGEEYPADEYSAEGGGDPGVSSSYYNDVTDTGVSSDGDVGYVSLGDGTFQDFGMD